MDELFSLKGRVALVTGASGHLGTAMCEALSGAEARVVLAGRNSEKLERLAERLRVEWRDVSTACFDVCDEIAVKAALGEIEKRFGRLDVLVNNAYSGKTGSIKTTTPDDFRNAYDSAVVSAHHLIQQAIPLLSKARALTGGTASVINVASMYGVVSPDGRIYGKSGLDNPPSYGAAKAALIQLTRYMATHLAQEGIRVNCLSPGPFPRDEIRRSQPDFHEKLCAKVPFGRIGAAREIQGPILFLASEASSYVTGANLPVDGGWTAW